MDFNANTHLVQVLEQYPWLAEVLPREDQRFAVMNTAAGKLMLRKFTIADVSRVSGHSVEELLAGLADIIRRHEG